MRRVLGLFLVISAFIPATVSAASWHRFSSKSFGFSLQYPPGWTLTKTDVPRQVLLQLAGRQPYSIQVVVLDLKPAATINATLSRVKSFERTRGNTQFVNTGWKSTSIAGRPAVVAIIRPSTEGGVAVSDGIYVTASRTHVYEITDVAYGATSISRFPSIYGKILRTWRVR